MAFNYYRNNGGWGTKQFQFPAPLAPSFQPQPSWHGQDYFRAHAGTPDLSLYNSAWNRVRDWHPDMDGGFGVGVNEARHWHSRAYGGLGNANQMLPAELGHAAAYEAYRTWMHSSSLYEPLSGDLDRQREGLVGLAIAEATRLLQFAGRGGYGRVEACDAAAATASLIFTQSRRGSHRGDYHDRSRSNSFSGYGAPAYTGSDSYGSAYGGAYGGNSQSPYAGVGSSAYMGSPSIDPYAGDNTFMYPAHHHHHRSHSRSGHRHRSHSHSRPRSPTVIVAPVASPYGGGYASPMAIPSAPVMQPTYSNGGYAGSYGTGAMGISPYRQSSPMQLYNPGGYAGSGVSVGGGVPQVLPAGTVVVQSSSRRRHRHSTSSSGHSRHHHRRRSDDDVPYGVPNYAGSGVPAYAGSAGYRY